MVCVRSTTAPLTDLYCSARRPLRKHTTLLYHSLPSTGTTTQDKQHRALLRPFDLGATLRASSYLNSRLPKNHTQALPKLFKPSFLQEAPISKPDKEEKTASQIHRKHQEKASESTPEYHHISIYHKQIQANKHPFHLPPHDD